MAKLKPVAVCSRNCRNSVAKGFGVLPPEYDKQNTVLPSFKELPECRLKKDTNMGNVRTPKINEIYSTTSKPSGSNSKVIEKDDVKLYSLSDDENSSSHEEPEVTLCNFSKITAAKDYLSDDKVHTIVKQKAVKPVYGTSFEEDLIQMTIGKKFYYSNEREANNDINVTAFKEIGHPLGANKVNRQNKSFFSCQLF